MRRLRNQACRLYFTLGYSIFQAAVQLMQPGYCLTTPFVQRDSSTRVTQAWYLVLRCSCSLRASTPAHSLSGIGGRRRRWGWVTWLFSFHVTRTKTFSVSNFRPRQIFGYQTHTYTYVLPTKYELYMSDMNQSRLRLLSRV